MLDFIKKSPFGFILTAAAIVLAVSPEAREATRKFAVKGTTSLLDLVDQARNSTQDVLALASADNNTNALNQSVLNETLSTSPSPKEQ